MNSDSSDEEYILKLLGMGNNSLSDENIDHHVNYCNPEVKKCDTSICKKPICPADLVTHIYDHPENKYTNNKYKKNVKILDDIKKMPQHEQKSQAWLDQRSTCLTATAIAEVLDEAPYKFPVCVLLDKCGRGKPFIENEHVHHGKKYEDVANMFYGYRTNVVVKEYGLLIHPKYKFVGASPDGIVDVDRYDGTGLTKSVGRMLEIKCVHGRIINTVGELDGTICPHYYYLQVLTQLYVTGLDECDFLQCKIQEYNDWEEYWEDSDPNMPGVSAAYGLEKGCLIQLLPRELINETYDDPKSDMCTFNAQYLYPPKLHMTQDEMKEWIALQVIEYPSNKYYEKYVIDKVIYWRFEKVCCHLIKAQQQWFQSIIPQLRQFWNYVIFCKKRPKILNNVEKLVEKHGRNSNDIIFKYIHKEYVKVHPDTTYLPLYQTKNKWRAKYDSKYSRCNWYG
jgi:putative phage-type endonuclease